MHLFYLNIIQYQILIHDECARSNQVKIDTFALELSVFLPHE